MESPFDERQVEVSTLSNLKQWHARRGRPAELGFRQAHAHIAPVETVSAQVSLANCVRRTIGQLFRAF